MATLQIKPPKGFILDEELKSPPPPQGFVLDSDTFGDTVKSTFKEGMANLPIGGIPAKTVLKGMEGIGKVMEAPIAGLRAYTAGAKRPFREGVTTPEKYPAGTFGKTLTEGGMTPTSAGILGSMVDIGYYFGLPELAGRMVTRGKVSLINETIGNLNKAIKKSGRPGEFVIPKEMVETAAKDKDIATVTNAYLKSKNVKIEPVTPKLEAIEAPKPPEGFVIDKPTTPQVIFEKAPPGGWRPEDKVHKIKPIITDQAQVQEIKNSIVEGESILKSGKTISGRKMSADELGAVQKSVDNAKAKITPIVEGGIDAIIDKEGDKTKWWEHTPQDETTNVKNYAPITRQELDILEKGKFKIGGSMFNSRDIIRKETRGADTTGMEGFFVRRGEGNLQEDTVGNRKAVDIFNNIMSENRGFPKLSPKEGLQLPTPTGEGKVWIQSRKTSKEYGPSWDIIDNGKKIGWIGGYEGVDKFNLRQTEISNVVDRGKGAYQKAIQQVANLYPEGLISKDFQMSTSLRKALLKMKNAIIDEEGNITIPPEPKLPTPTGEGVVAYHGTKYQFNDFDVKHLGKLTKAESAKNAFFFTDKKTIAEGYANLGDMPDVEKLQANVDRLEKIAQRSGNKADWNKHQKALVKYEDAALGEENKNFVGNIKEVNLDLKNPFIIDKEGYAYNEKELANWVKEAKAKGHDGVIIKNAADSVNTPIAGGKRPDSEISNVYAVFSPDQIKLSPKEGLQLPTPTGEGVDYLYHTTKSENIPSIIINGLGGEKTYLSPNESMAEKWKSIKGDTILRIKKSGLRIEDAYEGMKKTPDNIGQTQIEIKTESGWKPLASVKIDLPKPQNIGTKIIEINNVDGLFYVEMTPREGWSGGKDITLRDNGGKSVTRINNNGDSVRFTPKAKTDKGIKLEAIEFIKNTKPPKLSTPTGEGKVKTKAKIIRSLVELTPEDKIATDLMKITIGEGEAGQRIPVDQETAEPRTIGIESSFPAFFKNKGYTKKETLAIIDNVLSGKPITEKQKIIFNDLLEGSKTEYQKEIERYARDKQKTIAEAGEIDQSKIAEHIRDAQEDAQSEVEIETPDWVTKPQEGEVQLQIPGTEPKMPDMGLRPPPQKDLFQEKGELFTQKPTVETNDYVQFKTEGGVIKYGDVKIIKGTTYIIPDGATSSIPLGKGEIIKIEQREGRKFKPPSPAYSIDKDEYDRIATGRTISGGKEYVRKEIPPITKTGKVEWEKSEPWQVNLGRDIPGVFEREIGPKLQVSKRLTVYLGRYYPMLGPSGTIKVRSVADEGTLFHEAGHYLDDSLSGMTGWNVGKRGTVREELIKVTKWRVPFEETYIPTGKISKKTGKELMKQDSYTAYRRQSRELFAEYLSVYVDNPAKAKELAPTFTQIVEGEITKDAEFKYIVDTLRAFEKEFKPIKDYVKALRRIPEIQKDLQDWAEKGNVLQNLWRKQIGDKIWNALQRSIDQFSRKPIAREMFEKKGLSDQVFEILRQRKKLIDGQRAKFNDEIIQPVSKFSKEDQQYIAETLQRFEISEADTPLAQLTEKARKEISVWGNEARKLGLLNDETFWNNVGQYFPFFYEVKDFDKNKTQFGFFPSKQIKANLSGFKHKLTDEEMGRKVLESQLGTWPSSKAQIDEYPKEELIRLGRKARADMGLIKTAAYPLQKRIFQTIESVYTVKTFNIMSKLPGIMGTKDTPGYAKMPEGKRFGDLSGQYVPENLVKEVNTWTEMKSEIGDVFRLAVTVWKNFKVPFSPMAIARNIVVNGVVSWMGDVPMLNPVVGTKGIKSFVTQDEAYQILRDRGLYKHTYTQVELQNLAFLMEKEPENIWDNVVQWAVKIFEKPGDLYGAIEDASKTVIARYVLDKGGSPEQAVKFADKLLFDYSSTSKLVGELRKHPFPFLTWSAKIFPRLVEYAIRKPEKYIFLLGLVAILSAIARSRLGISEEEEERLKPDYLRGKSAILMPGKDENGQLNWIDMSYFFPWGGWQPTQKGKLGFPSVLTMGNPLLILYNAYILNYDPFYGEIAKSYMTDIEKDEARNKYLTKSLGPDILTTLPNEIINAVEGKKDKYGRTPNLSKILSRRLLGINLISDTSLYRSNMLKRFKLDYGIGKSGIKKRILSGELPQEKGFGLLKKQQEKYQEQLKTH